MTLPSATVSGSLQASTSETPIYAMTHRIDTGVNTPWHEKWNFGMQRNLDESGTYRFLLQHTPHRQVTDAQPPQPIAAVVEGRLTEHGLELTSSNEELTTQLPKEIASAWSAYTAAAVLGRYYGQATSLTPSDWEACGASLTMNTQDAGRWQVRPEFKTGAATAFRVAVENADGPQVYLHMNSNREFVENAVGETAIPHEVAQAAHASVSALETGRYVAQAHAQDIAMREAARPTTADILSQGMRSAGGWANGRIQERKAAANAPALIAA